MADDNYIDATKDAVEPAPGAAPARVVRTYASDFAAASGQPQPVTPLAPAPAPSMVPSPEPPAPVVPPPAPAAPQEDREAILARLRAKVNAEKPAEPPMEEPRQAPVFDVAQEAEAVPSIPPIRSAADRLIEASPIVVPETFVPPAPVAPPPVAPPKVNDAAAGLHTYKSDFAGRIDEKGASAASVLAAQADAPRRAASAPVKKSSIVLVVFGIVVILFGAGAIYAAYGYLKASNIVPTVQTAPSLIFVDERLEIKGVGNSLLTALADAAAAPLASGAIRLTYVALGTTTTPASGDVLVNALQLPAPDILLRSVQPESTVGAVHAGDEQRAFFILRVDSYERSFAGMLTWEGTIAQDLTLLYPPYAAPAAPVMTAPVATSTISTTTAKDSKGRTIVVTKVTPIIPPAVQTPPAASPVFRDEVVASHDVRVLRDASGRSLIMYGFWNQTTLIIARDEPAFTELVNRLATTRQQ